MSLLTPKHPDIADSSGNTEGVEGGQAGNSIVGLDNSLYSCWLIVRVRQSVRDLAFDQYSKLLWAVVLQ